VLFIAQTFVDIVHGSDFCGKFQGCIILFPAIIHIESAIPMLLMSENVTH
jgi:hypothetical protein